VPTPADRLREPGVAESNELGEVLGALGPSGDLLVGRSRARLNRFGVCYNYNWVVIARGGTND